MTHRVLERVLVTGSKGQLGAAFMTRLADGVHVTGIDVDDVDLTDPALLRESVRRCRPTAIINCAAFTDVDGAEARPLDAYRVNAEAVWCLAGLASELDAVLVHYSTEFVYDGKLDRPYTEEEDTAPQSVYGMTKLVGERFALSADRSYALRLSSLYGGHTRRTTVDWILRQAQAGQPVTAFADRTVSPSYVPEVVEATLELLVKGAPFGLYNCGSARLVQLGRRRGAGAGGVRPPRAPGARALRRATAPSRSSQELHDVERQAARARCVGAENMERSPIRLPGTDGHHERPVRPTLSRVQPPPMTGILAARPAGIGETGWLGGWPPGIGDPTVLGWATVAGYVVAAWLCYRASIGTSSDACRAWSIAWRERILWRILVGILLALGINKQLDLQSAMTELLRIVARGQGWYDSARIPGGFHGTARHRRPDRMGGLVAFSWKMSRSVKIAGLGLSLLGAFVLMRAASIHHVDALIRHSVSSLTLDWIMELGGIGVIAFGAVHRMIQPSPAPPGAVHPTQV